MDGFVLTLTEARVMYRRYHSLLEKREKTAAWRRILEGIGHCLAQIRSKPEGGTSPVFPGTLPLFPGKAHYGQAFPRPAFCSESFLTGRKSHPVPLVSGRMPGIRPKGGAAAEGLRMGWFF